MDTADLRTTLSVSGADWKAEATELALAAAADLAARPNPTDPTSPRR